MCEYNPTEEGKFPKRLLLALNGVMESSAEIPSLNSYPRLEAGGGNKMGDGALDGLAEWILRVLKGPRNGLVEGVNAEVVFTAEELCGGECSTE